MTAHELLQTVIENMIDLNDHWGDSEGPVDMLPSELGDLISLTKAQRNKLSQYLKKRGVKYRIESGDESYDPDEGEECETLFDIPTDVVATFVLDWLDSIKFFE